MDTSKRKAIAEGLRLSAGYCAIYLVLWYPSFDQWFLPLALRFTCLFFLPYRLWPYVFLGDAAAFLALRVPKADTHSMTWAIVSSFISLPLTSLAAVGMKRFITEINRQPQWFPLAALTLAIAAVTSNAAIKYVFSGPIPGDLVNTLLIMVTGQYLGALTLAPLFFLGLRWREAPFPLRPLLTSSAFAALIMGVMLGFVVLAPDSSNSVRQVTLVLLILPATFLTMLHGWSGAAISVTLINIAVSLTLKHTGIAGAHDSVVFMPQIVLAMGATLLLVSGAKLTEHYDLARRSGLAEVEARQLAHSSFPSTEAALREHLVYLAHMQLVSDDSYKEAMDWLQANGHAQLAMDLNARRVAQRRLFELRAQALYPMRIESEGLFSAAYCDEFSDFWGGDAEIRRSCVGEPLLLTRDLQLNAYRCLCHAMTIYADTQPSTYRIWLRVWQGRSRRGIYLRVTADMTDPTRVTLNGATAASLLESRVLASGGILRMNRYRIALWLSESNDAVSTPVIPVPEW